MVRQINVGLSGGQTVRQSDQAMSLFYYRPWAGVGAENGRPGYLGNFLSPADPLYYTRWGYFALLTITMVVGLLLNTVYLAGYWLFPRAALEVPHVAIASLAVRDLLVCLLVIPASLDWLVAGLVSWPGGEIWCKTAVFFDYYLLTLHPLLLTLLAIILFTRKVPPKLPETPQPPAHLMQSRMSARSGYPQSASHRSHHSSGRHPGPPAGRAPSVSGSVMSGSVISASGGGRHQGFRKGFAKKEGSVNGSYAGSVSGSVNNRSQFSPNRSGRGPRASSPLGHLEEESVDGELWELASMEYPGKNDGLDLDFDDDDDVEPDEPRLREWLKYAVWAVWLVAFGFGVPAVQQAKYSAELAPGCYFVAEERLIAQAKHSYFIQDPTINLLISSVFINYMIPSTLLIILSILLCTVRWTQDGKLNRFFKMTIGLCVMFLAARSPIDILQFIDIIHTSQGSTITNKRPDQLGEILLSQYFSDITFTLNLQSTRSCCFGPGSCLWSETPSSTCSVSRSTGRTSRTCGETAQKVSIGNHFEVCRALSFDLSGKKEEEYNDQQFLDVQQYGEPVKSSHTVETDVL